MNLSGGPKPEVIDIREDWDEALGLYLKYLSDSREEGWSVVWCGDLKRSTGARGSPPRGTDC